VTWSRFPPPGTKSPQPPPTGLTGYRPTQALTHPGCYRTSTPLIATWRRPCQRIAQLLLTILREEWSSGLGARSSISDCVRSVSIVPAGQVADPEGRVAGNSGNRRGREAKAQEPEKVPAAPLNGISSRAVVEFELADSEVRSKVDVSCHPHVLQRYRAPAYECRRRLPRRHSTEIRLIFP
jgi:hypothetical protein